MREKLIAGTATSNRGDAKYYKLLKATIEENYPKMEIDFGEVVAVISKLCMKMEVGQGGEILCSKILISPTLGRILGS